MQVIAFSKWCQHLPLDEQARRLAGAGVDGVDLPCRPGAPITPANAPERLPEAQRVFADHGLKLERLVTGLRAPGAETERLLAACRELGIRDLRVGAPSFGHDVPADSDPRQILDRTRRELAALAAVLEKHGVRGAVQNHSGFTLAINISSCLLMLQDCNPQWLGVQYDPGHCLLSGEPPRLALGLLGPYLQSVNLKSPRYEVHPDPRSGRLTYTPVWGPLADGMLDVPHLLEELRRAGYATALSLHAEYRTYFYRIEHDTEATFDLLAGDVAYLRPLLMP